MKGKSFLWFMIGFNCMVMLLNLSTKSYWLMSVNVGLVIAILIRLKHLR